MAFSFEKVLFGLPETIDDLKLAVYEVVDSNWLIIQRQKFDLVLDKEPFHALQILFGLKHGQYYVRVFGKTRKLGQAHSLPELQNLCIRTFQNVVPCVGHVVNKESVTLLADDAGIVKTDFPIKRISATICEHMYVLGNKPSQLELSGWGLCKPCRELTISYTGSVKVELNLVDSDETSLESQQLPKQGPCVKNVANNKLSHAKKDSRVLSNLMPRVLLPKFECQGLKIGSHGRGCASSNNEREHASQEEEDSISQDQERLEAEVWIRDESVETLGTVTSPLEENSVPASALRTYSRKHTLEETNEDISIDETSIMVSKTELQLEPTSPLDSNGIDQTIIVPDQTKLNPDPTGPLGSNTNILEQAHSTDPFSKTTNNSSLTVGLCDSQNNSGEDGGVQNNTRIKLESYKAHAYAKSNSENDVDNDIDFEPDGRYGESETNLSDSKKNSGENARVQNSTEQSVHQHEESGKIVPAQPQMHTDLYKCSECGNSFQSKQGLTRHVDQMHKAKAECKKCGKQVGCYRIKSHMGLHTGEKPYKCPHCSMAYRSSTSRQHRIYAKHPKHHIPQQKSLSRGSVKSLGTKSSMHNQRIFVHRETTKQSINKSNGIDQTLIVADQTKLKYQPTSPSGSNGNNLEQSLRTDSFTKTKNNSSLTEGSCDSGEDGGVQSNTRRRCKSYKTPDYAGSSSESDVDDDDNNDNNDDIDFEPDGWDGESETDLSDSHNNSGEYRGVQNNAEQTDHQHEKCGKVVPMQPQMHTRPYKCSECSESFQTKQTLTRHVDHVHKGPAPKVQCKVCGKHMIYDIIKFHMRLHTGEKPYKCPHCSMSYHSSTSRQHHIYAKHPEHHTAQLNSLSTGNGKSPSTKSSLHNHRILVHGEMTKQSIHKSNGIDQTLIVADETKSKSKAASPLGLNDNNLEQSHNTDSFSKTRNNSSLTVGQNNSFEYGSMQGNIRTRHKRYKTQAYAESNSESDLDDDDNDIDFEPDGRDVESDRNFSDSQNYSDDYGSVQNIAEQSAHQCEKSDKIVPKSLSRESGNYLGTKSSLSDHNILLHGGKSKQAIYPCTECGKMFHMKQSRYKHYLAAHTERYKCGECGKCFGNKSGLTKHVDNLHNQAPKAECKECGKQMRSSWMKIHLCLHTGEKPYKCPYCSISYSSYYSRKQHIYAKHKGPVPKPECKVCGKQVTHRRFKNHMRLHTGEKPFKCPHCSMSYHSTSSRLQHINRTHPEHQKPRYKTKQKVSTKNRGRKQNSKVESSKVKKRVTAATKRKRKVSTTLNDSDASVSEGFDDTLNLTTPLDAREDFEKPLSLTTPLDASWGRCSFA